ncbi:hypothetical protein CBA19CS22_06510 [Caballeronia novacaledonica]|uniref:Uncharacterized protein n=1 Tax=Caballeronia novacaledonica TaxID=1544861 RepID=A0ACB5QMJ6_9BURK|nr:hypothetical protein CBA19CS22_06510 [Caballeronia novacaledonica]
MSAVVASKPQPIAQAMLTHDIAWGGTDRTCESSGQTDACHANPVGRGYWRHSENIDGQPLPQTEESGRSVDSPTGRYVPQAFSPIDRNWAPRHALAGRYDEKWLSSRTPFWHDDFDERYFQAAPADQVIACPAGGEPVVLMTLTSNRRVAFALPSMPMPVTYIPYAGRDVVSQDNIDTIVFDTDTSRFMMTWRRARRVPGKTYYASLDEAVRACRERRRA